MNPSHFEKELVTLTTPKDKSRIDVLDGRINVARSFGAF